jgi:hypothetical protein
MLLKLYFKLVLDKAGPTTIKIMDVASYCPKYIIKRWEPIIYPPLPNQIQIFFQI